MIKQLWEKYKHIIAYLFWGVVTTVINLAVFQILSSGIHWNYQLANVIAWFVSVLVATVSDFLVEMLRFFFYRALTLVIDIVITFIGISVLGFKDPMGKFIVKVIDNVIVVIANYVFSKWLIFKDNKQIEDQ